MDNFTLDQIAGVICGGDQSHPVYRSGPTITEFFEKAGLPQFVHDGSGRQKWVLEKLQECDRKQLSLVLKRLASPREYGGDREKIALALKTLNEILYIEGFKIVLDGLHPKFEKISVSYANDDESVSELKPMPPPDFLILGLETGIGEILENRWGEAQKCVDSGAYLSAIIIMGSMLEGLLLGVCKSNIEAANRCQSAPKNTKTGKVLPFQQWKLAEFIDVAHHVGWLEMDVKKFSHVLRDFRNLVHPYEQLRTQTSPDEDTCNISWLVVRAAVNDLAAAMKNSE